MYLGTDLKLIAAVRQVLTVRDYRLIACSDRGGAVMFLESEIPYDLLLIDLEWQGTEGLKMAQLARSLRHRKRMPTILVTPTKLSNKLKTLAREAGISKYVTKTSEGIVLSEAIRQLIYSPSV
ncbi:MAG TPA: response regulator [Pyrinomonadaceae bacterium]|nr:response regulator [Pyrinomonadaceae bacterium]